MKRIILSVLAMVLCCGQMCAVPGVMPGTESTDNTIDQTGQLATSAFRGIPQGVYSGERRFTTTSDFTADDEGPISGTITSPYSEEFSLDGSLVSGGLPLGVGYSRDLASGGVAGQGYLGNLGYEED